MAESTVPMPQQPGAGDEIAREGTRAQEQYYRPPVDIHEDAQGLTLIADLPGVDKNDVDVQVRDAVLSIQGHSKSVLPGAPIYREFELVNFFREFEISDAVDVANIRADMQNGVLTLRVPRSERAKPRKIDVQLG